MVLTPEGERFLPLAQQHRALEAKMQALGQGAPESQLLRVSSFNSIGTYLLPPVYRRFAERWPDIRLEIKDIFTAVAINAIVRDELDIAFSTLSISNEHVTAIPFLSEPLAFLCAGKSGYPDPVSLDSLSNADEIYSFWCADVQQWHQATFGADAAPRVNLELACHFPLFTAQPNAWAIVPHSIAKALKDAPGLRQCRMDFPVPERRLYILCNRKSRNSEPVTRFLECLREELQAQEMPGLLL